MTRANGLTSPSFASAIVISRSVTDRARAPAPPRQAEEGTAISRSSRRVGRLRQCRARQVSTRARGREAQGQERAARGAGAGACDKDQRRGADGASGDNHGLAPQAAHHQRRTLSGQESAHSSRPIFGKFCREGCPALAWRDRHARRVIPAPSTLRARARPRRFTRGRAAAWLE
jgi:hypothetical protein